MVIESLYVIKVIAICKRKYLKGKIAVLRVNQRGDFIVAHTNRGF